METPHDRAMVMVPASLAMLSTPNTMPSPQSVMVPASGPRPGRRLPRTPDRPQRSSSVRFTNDPLPMVVGPFSQGPASRAGTCRFFDNRDAENRDTGLTRPTGLPRLNGQRQAAQHGRERGAPSPRLRRHRFNAALTRMTVLKPDRFDATDRSAARQDVGNAGRQDQTGAARSPALARYRYDCPISWPDMLARYAGMTRARPNKQAAAASRSHACRGRERVPSREWAGGEAASNVERPVELHLDAVANRSLPESPMSVPRTGPRDRRSEKMQRAQRGSISARQAPEAGPRPDKS